jgi:type I restriction enzyme M protein
LLFCKIFNETNTGLDDVVTFRSGQGEEAEVVHKRLVNLFAEVKTEYNDVFNERDEITLDAASLVYVVGELQTYCITDADRDAVGEAFEVFIGPALRGTEGQFFTPRNVVRMLVKALDPAPGEMLIDPACGSGGFLIVALEHVWAKLDAEGRMKGWTAVQLDRRKREIATRTFRGIDKDAFLSKVTKAYMAIIGDGRGGVFCENSLQPTSEWSHHARERIQLGFFDVVVTNPPFGSKIRIKGAPILGQFDLGHKWKKDRKTGELVLTSTLQRDQPPQLLFLERCLQLLKPGGRLGIVLPESILGNPSYRHVLTWLESQASVEVVATMPEPLFKTSGKGGTHTKVAVLVVRKGSPATEDMFMADALWCGHDSRGNPTLREAQDGSLSLLDDVPTVAANYEAYRSGHLQDVGHLGFVLAASSRHDSILVPKYYNPELKSDLASLANTHDLILVGNLVSAGALSLSTGVEVGKMAYGTGPVPFIRTSDISNWELKSDPKHAVSEHLYAALKERVDVRSGDILMVRDGTYLIGTCAVVTEHDLPMLYQSHIIKIRVGDDLDPWLFFAALNTPIVKRQIRSKQFTQDIIDTLGSRLLEVMLPIPKDIDRQRGISEQARSIVTTRAEYRQRARQLALSVEGAAELGDDVVL